jgi:hypothetical protein
MDIEAVVFVYTGPGGDIVPRDVVRVRVDPSVTSIPARAFYKRMQLAEVDRFDRLPVHSSVYFQSYHQGALQHLIDAINTKSGLHQKLRSMLSQRLRGKLNPTGNQQDCLGMTPLHILACSSVHNLEMYRLIVAKYPANLITVDDRWGATPLLYAFWGAAPVEIINFLINSYYLIYPDYVFNWTMMVETMGRCDTPKENIESLLCAKQMHFLEQPYAT